MSHVCHRYSSNADQGGRCAFFGGGAKGLATVTPACLSEVSIGCVARSSLVRQRSEQGAVQLLTDFVRSDYRRRGRHWPHAPNMTAPYGCCRDSMLPRFWRGGQDSSP